MNRATRAQRNASTSARAEIIRVLTTSMAEDGPAIRVALERSIMGPVKSGHIVDALMSATAKWNDAIEVGDTALAFKTMVGVLWLARALAHSEGKIQEKPAAQA
jgi:hypothetical protein